MYETKVDGEDGAGVRVFEQVGNEISPGLRFLVSCAIV